MPTTIVSWNIAKRHEPWRQLLQMDADIALLQEAGNPPPDVADRVDTGPVEHWDSHVWNSRWYEGRFDNLYDRWPMVVRLSDLGGHGRDSLVVTTSSILLVVLTCQYVEYILSVSFVCGVHPWRLTQGKAEPSKSQLIAAGVGMSGSPRTCIRPKPPGSARSARVPIGTGPTSSVGNSPLDTGGLRRLIDSEARGSA